MEKEFEFHLKEHIAIMSVNKKGVVLALNRVSFGDNPVKLDVRRWWNDRPGKGIQLTDEEARALLAALESYFADSEQKETEESGKKEGQHED